MKPKCAACPLNGEDTPCLGVEDPERFHYFCQWAIDGVASEKSAIVGRSRIAKESEGTTPIPRMTVAPMSPSVAHQLKIQALVRKCEHRDTSVPCGCGMSICKLNKGEGIDKSRVSQRECQACQESRLTDSP